MKFRAKLFVVLVTAAVAGSGMLLQRVSAKESTSETGDFVVKGGTLGEDYQYQDGQLTILDEKELTISGKVRGGGIIVKEGVNAELILKNLTISTGHCPIDLEGSDVVITIEGSNALTSSGSDPGIRVPANASLTLLGEDNASLRVKGGEKAAGIGCSAAGGRAFGNITFDGGRVTATGGNGGAGIGSGKGGGSGKITVLSGDITAAGGMDAVDVGNESKATKKCTTTLEGNGILRADEISGTVDTVEGILLSDKNAAVYGTPELEADLNIQQGNSLYIEEMAELTIPQEAKLTNRGEIVVYGTLCVDGSLDNRGGSIFLYGDGEVLGESNIQGNEPENIEEGVILIGQGDILITDEGYKQNGVSHAMTGGKKIYIRGTGKKSSNRIVVEENVTAGLYLDEVQISAENGKSALEIGNGASVTIFLTGSNVLQAERMEEALLLKEGAGVRLEGNGRLGVEGREDRNQIVWYGTDISEEEEQKEADSEENVETDESEKSEESLASSAKRNRKREAENIYETEIKTGEALTTDKIEEAGLEEEGILEVSVDGTSQGSCELGISRSALQKMIDQKAGMYLQTNLASIEMNTDALKDLQKVTRGDISIRLAPFSLEGTNFTKAKAAIGTRPVYDIQIIEKTSGGSTVKNIAFGSGEVTVLIPYTKPSSGEEIQMVYVGADNTIQWLEDSYYDDENGRFCSKVSHFSVYGIGSREKQTAAEGWKKESDGNYAYYYADGSKAVNTTIDGYQIDAQGKRVEQGVNQ